MLKLLHCLAYAGLSGAYTASLVGVNKDWISIAAAIVYLILALDALLRR